MYGRAILLQQCAVGAKLQAQHEMVQNHHSGAFVNHLVCFRAVWVVHTRKTARVTFALHQNLVTHAQQRRAMLESSSRDPNATWACVEEDKSGRTLAVLQWTWVLAVNVAWVTHDKQLHALAHQMGYAMSAPNKVQPVCFHLCLDIWRHVKVHAFGNVFKRRKVQGLHVNHIHCFAGNLFESPNQSSNAHDAPTNEKGLWVGLHRAKHVHIRVVACFGVVVARLERSSNGRQLRHVQSRNQKLFALVQENGARVDFENYFAIWHGFQHLQRVLQLNFDGFLLHRADINVERRANDVRVRAQTLLKQQQSSSFLKMLGNGLVVATKETAVRVVERLFRCRTHHVFCHHGVVVRVKYSLFSLATRC
eukprot:m.285157 g.285157  ORF g.285157 m.285157 type:complete len:364 (+) comp19430_c6_seq9:1148-2239(+)